MPTILATVGGISFASAVPLYLFTPLFGSLAGSAALTVGCLSLGAAVGIAYERLPMIRALDRHTQVL